MPVMQGIPANIANLFETGFLQRYLEDALQPGYQFRALAESEKWNAEVGQELFITRKGLRNPAIRPLEPGQDLPTSTFSTEQYVVSISQRGDSCDTDLLQASISIKKFLDEASGIVQGARWTIDRCVRNCLFQAYTSGDTNVTVASTSSTQLSVASLGGFRQKLNTATGKLADVSTSNALAVTVNGVANTVVGYAAADAAFPDGPGVLYLGTSISATLRWRVLAANRPYIVYPAGVTTGVDGISAGSVMTASMINAAVKQLRNDRVPTMPDGYYHLKADPTTMQELLEDANLRQLFQGVPDGDFKKGVISAMYGVKFFMVDDSISTENTSITLVASGSSAFASPEAGCDVINATGIPIKRSVLVGGMAVREYIYDEMALQRQMEGSPAGVQTIGGQVPNLVGGCRYILRPPIDRKMQVAAQSFTMTSGYVCPPDELAATSASRQKRAVVFTHA